MSRKRQNVVVLDTNILVRAHKGETSEDDFLRYCGDLTPRLVRIPWVVLMEFLNVGSEDRKARLRLLQAWFSRRWHRYILGPLPSSWRWGYRLLTRQRIFIGPSKAEKMLFASFENFADEMWDDYWKSTLQEELANLLLKTRKRTWDDFVRGVRDQIYDLWLKIADFWADRKTGILDNIIASMLLPYTRKAMLWLATHDRKFGHGLNTVFRKRRIVALRGKDFVQRFCEKAGELEDEGRWPPKRCFWQHWAKDLAW
ncbi:MAG: hypothetical protein DRP82_00330 [Planctomycetota bacterium]|nr:MAG: hypothetical protein DRP82_00330 [Planctomycetota bacterium]